MLSSFSRHSGMAEKKKKKKEIFLLNEEPLGVRAVAMIFLTRIEQHQRHAERRGAAFLNGSILSYLTERPSQTTPHD